MKIKSFADLKKALIKRMDFFDTMGCRISDHGLDYVMYNPLPAEDVEAIF